MALAAEKRKREEIALLRFLLIIAGSGRPIVPIIDLGDRGYGRGRSARRNRERADEPSPIPSP